MASKRDAGEQLGEIVAELAGAERKARRRGKAEDWHRLRTTSRRLRGALIAHGAVLSVDLGGWLARRARRITRLPGKVRDLDVALENLTSLLVTLGKGPDSAAEREVAREMVGELEEKRARRVRRLERRLVRDQPVADLAAVLRKALRRGRDASDPAPTPPAEVLASCARAVLDRRAAVRGWQDDEALHALRVAVKKYRNALDSFAGTPTPARVQKSAQKSLQRLQRLLGEHHDWSELARRLARRHAALAARGRGRGKAGAGGKEQRKAITARKRKARSRRLAGYQALRARARREQHARFEIYRRELQDLLPRLLEVDFASSSPASGRRTRTPPSSRRPHRRHPGRRPGLPAVDGTGPADPPAPLPPPGAAPAAEAPLSRPSPGSRPGSGESP